MRNFCKKIADIIRFLLGGIETTDELIVNVFSKILYYFCAYWCLIRTELLEAERRALQNEVNRIVLQAIYYIVSKRRYEKILTFITNLSLFQRSDSPISCGPSLWSFK
jgi:hypothetical protein